MILYRPVGQNEVLLIKESGWSRFPPRLREQPIFYPVCNESYATRIARVWNTKGGKTGYVTRFEIDDDFIASYETHIVGDSTCEEYWIPAEDLESFNDHILGAIEVISTWTSPEITGN